jgi:hypothetical protein
MFSKSLSIAVFIYCLCSISANAFNEFDTQRKLTEAAIRPVYSDIDNYFVKFI